MGLILLIIGAGVLVGGHFLLSSAPVRARLIAALGEIPFLGVYSTVALAGLILMIWGYGAADYVGLWFFGGWMRWLPTLVMPVALLLIAASYLAPTPTALMRDDALDRPIPDRDGDGGPPPLGMTAVTRHPAMWGIALFALAHIPPNGDLASLVLFASLAILALGGAAHIDAKLANRHPDGWSRFSAITSYWPFHAIAQGRVRFSAGQVGWPPLAAAVVAYAMLLHLHEWAIGVSPFALP